MIRSAAQYLFAMSDPAGRFRTLGVPRVVPPGNFRTGNDAVVFRVERDGKPEMLKCYLRPPQYMPERCRCSQLSPLTASCRWLENEMLISDENGSPQWVDVTVGEWIEGESLHDLLFKAVIDRTVARWLEVKNKEFYYIVTCADTERESAETTLACFRGYADCVQGARECGVIYGTGVYEKGKIEGTPAYTQAYEMGRGV